MRFRCISSFCFRNRVAAAAAGPWGSGLDTSGSPPTTPLDFIQTLKHPSEEPLARHFVSTCQTK